MFIRQLEYLPALDRERHFGRAAAACHVSQPTLSTGIRGLERELGVPLVRRGREFEALTPEGELILGWAQRALADLESLKQEASRLRGGLEGALRIGAIPTALAASPPSRCGASITCWCCRRTRRSGRRCAGPRRRSSRSACSHPTCSTAGSS